MPMNAEKRASNQARRDIERIAKECLRIPYSRTPRVDPDGLAAIMSIELRALAARIHNMEDRFRRAESSLRESGVL
jgi:hypothetical protein